MNAMDNPILVPRYVKPVLVLNRGNLGSNIWDPYGVKIQRDLKLYSDIEYYHWVLVEANPKIYAYCEQAVKMLSLVSGKQRGSVIDMYILWNDGTEEFREIKPKNKIEKKDKDPKLKRQIEIQESWCAKQGVKHTIITEDEILKNEMLIKNWINILGDLKKFKDDPLQDIIEIVIELISRNYEMTINNIFRSLDHIDRTKILVAIFRLIHSGYLKAPLDKMAFSYAIPVSING